jgi:DNA-binding IclR family transcriptional regulator
MTSHSVQLQAPELPGGREPPRSVLGRALRILAAFGPRDTELRLTELADRTGLPKPTVHRLVAELVSWGALERGEDGLRLGFRLSLLGERVPRHHTLRELALPFMEDLYEATHESIHLGVLDGLEVLYIAKVTGERASAFEARIDERLPSHCTAVGKVLLAFGQAEVVRAVLAAGLQRRTPSTIGTPDALLRELKATLDRGYGIGNQEAIRGIASVAAPVNGPDGTVVAGLSITGEVSRLDPDRFAPAVRTAALSLSRELAKASAIAAL